MPIIWLPSLSIYNLEDMPLSDSRTLVLGGSVRQVKLLSVNYQGFVSQCATNSNSQCTCVASHLSDQFAGYR